MHTSRRLAGFLFLLLLVGLRAEPAKRFPHEVSDLPADPAVHWGRLDNGIRYAVLANHEPKGRISLRFAVTAGALEETDDQRGLAHFLEHLAFNGSTHFPPGTLVEYFQRNGMSFGGDTNAFTASDRTEYQLELPDTKPETLAQGLTLFSDYAGGLLLTPASIEKERGIIESERRARDSVDYRAEVDEFKFLFPQGRYPERMPIGLPEVIEHAQRDRFTDYYNTWYRPEHMIVAVVGDVDPAAAEAAIRDHLSGVKARGPARPFPALDDVPAHPGLGIRLHTDADAPSLAVTLESVSPYRDEPDRVAVRLQRLPRELAVAMLNRRLSELTKKEDAPFLSGEASAGEEEHFFRVASIALNCEPAKWRETLSVAEQEVRRALQFGFQESELREAVADARNGLEQSVKTVDARRSGPLADSLVDSMIDGKVFAHPAAWLKLYGPALEKVTVEDCQNAFSAAWNAAAGRHVYLSGNLSLDDAENQITAAYNASAAIPVAAPEKAGEVKFAYADFGPAGEIVSRQEIADLGVTQLEFRNGVRVNLKSTDFEAGKIGISVRVGGGKLSEPTNTAPGLSFFADNLLLAGGLGQHSADDLRRLLAGRTVETQFGIENDTFAFAGGTNRADLELQLDLLCAYLTDPGFRPEALRALQKNIGPYYAELSHSVEGPLNAEVPRLMANGDPRFGIPTRSAMLAHTVDEVKAWLGAEFAHGPIEVAIVGDFDREATFAALAKTFGALTARSPKPAYDEARHVSFPPAPLAKTFRTPTDIPRGAVAFYWPATDARDVKLSRRLAMLGRILSDRLRVQLREKMGGTYSPEAGADLSDTYWNYGFLVANAVVEPNHADQAVDAIKAVAADLARHGVTDDELQRAKLPTLTMLHESARTNGYWLGSVLASAQEYPQKLDWSRTRLADNEAITAAELSALAARYLPPDHASTFISLPGEKAPPGGLAKNDPPGIVP